MQNNAEDGVPWDAGVHAKLLQSCLTLCTPMDYGPPGFSVRGIFQARIPKWVAVSFARGSSRSRDRTHVSYVSCIGRWVRCHGHHVRCWGEACFLTPRLAPDRCVTSGIIFTRLWSLDTRFY